MNPPAYDSAFRIETCLQTETKGHSGVTSMPKHSFTCSNHGCEPLPAGIKISNNFGLTLHAWKKIYLGKCNDVLLLAISSAAS